MSQASGTACLPGSLACLAEISSQLSIPVLLGQKGLPRGTDNGHGPTNLQPHREPFQTSSPRWASLPRPIRNLLQNPQVRDPKCLQLPTRMASGQNINSGPQMGACIPPLLLVTLGFQLAPHFLLPCLNFSPPDSQSSGPGAGRGGQRCRLQHLQFFPVPGPPGMGRSPPESQSPLVSSCPECEVFPHLGMRSASRGAPTPTPCMDTDTQAEFWLPGPPLFCKVKCPPSTHNPHISPCVNPQALRAARPTYTPSTSADFFLSTIWMSRAPAGMWVTRE